ncbi:iron chelate uptake ABC transporter family permease subunit [Ensifer adhaerens]|uniref:iron chelate uptake ABC transporter family permease subunit n=1 Tax=Ensifer adhaerens TaxID=106592 RepID=UPI001F1F6932|nr:iron chelate uptake ABC transporter family permease subunit [Ensifer adhaerens]
MLVALVGIAALSIFFVFVGSGLDFAYIIPRRLTKLAAMIVGGIAVGLSSIVFQTIAGNRILTPAVMGYEAVYLLLQALLVLILGTSSLMVLGDYGNFLASILMMVAYSLVIHHWLFKGPQLDAGQPLLVGLVLTMVIGTFTQFVQLRISPGEFAIFQGFSLISFDRVEPVQLLWSTGFVAVVCLAGSRSLAVLDLMALGRDQALSLGVDYQRHVRLLLGLIAVLVAVSTSLIGPTAFMGIFVANLAYACARSERHRVTLPLGCLIAIGMFLVAQLSVEHVFNYRTTVGILINLACGAWFLALTLRFRDIA